MFGRKKQEFIRPHAPLPKSRPAAPEVQTEPFPPHRCPLTQIACRDNCAWMVEGECAATYLAREVFTLVEVLARSQTLPLGAGDPSPNRSPAAPAVADESLPSGAVVLPQAPASPARE